ncbi:DUF4333 domain-containing protein [Nocardioides panacisoli]|uniref:DUF4333 domain-containing protein n=1 Tax=Nocardioides panacisoli TaxID=627624 RepID=UPI001C62726B|nr:DUF4333 domain-containing protein [Nocardioides panacisoli]QYJ03039.1 DUF4333 domain-containing protein [Nocardioides panacisoli]
MRRLLSLVLRSLAALLLLSAVTGCSDDAPAAEPSVPEGWSTTGAATAGAPTSLARADLVDQLTDALPVDAPLGSFDVTCEGDLAGVVGARQVCTIERDGGRTGALVETIAVDGDTVQWEEQYFVHAADLEEALPGRIRERGGDVDTVTCPSSLPGEVGAEMTCTATGGIREVALTVRSIDGLRVDFDFEAR